MSAVVSAKSSWQAQLDLEFTKRDRRTVISHCLHKGPLTIQRPFYPEDDVCHTYLLHPPGGVVGGDQLTLNVNVKSHAHALITTPAATKFYRSNGDVAWQRQVMHVAGSAILEWLPQETIVFNAAKLNILTQVNLDEGARFAGWEILCLGRPASGETFERGECRQRLEIFREGDPVVMERTNLVGGSEIQKAKWGLADFPVTATMLVTDIDKEVLDKVREISTDERIRFSATLIKDILVCRYLGYQGIEARECFTAVWEVLRKIWIDKSPCQPRIWHT